VQESRGLLKDDLLPNRLAAMHVRGSKVHDVDPAPGHTRSPQAAQQLPPAVRGVPAPDDDTLWVDIAKRAGKGFRPLTKPGHHLGDRARQLPPYSLRELDETELHGRGAQVIADDYDGCLLWVHQP